MTWHHITLHCITLPCIAVTLHYLALHCITLHYIAWHCITLHCITYVYIYIYMHTHTEIFFIHTHRNIYMHKRTHTHRWYIYTHAHTHTQIYVYIYILIYRGNVHIIPLSFYIMSYELSFIQFTYGGVEIFLGKVILILVPMQQARALSKKRASHNPVLYYPFPYLFWCTGISHFETNPQANLRRLSPQPRHLLEPCQPRRYPKAAARPLAGWSLLWKGVKHGW